MPEPGARLFRRPNAWSRSGALLPPSPPAEKATASKDQAGKPGTSDGAGNHRCTRNANCTCSDFTVVSDFTDVEKERTTGYNRARQVDCKLSTDAEADKPEGPRNGGGRVSVEAVESRNSIVDL